MYWITADGGLHPDFGISLLGDNDQEYITAPRKTLDAFWKYTIEEMFEHFFRFFKPRLAQYFDLTHIEFLDKEQGKIFPDKSPNIKTRFVDKLVKVYRKNSDTRFVIFHIEVQGNANSYFPERMFEYYYRLRGRYQSPIIALAIITDGGSGTAPIYEDSYDETKIQYEYSVYRIKHKSEKELLKSRNPFALIILIAQKGLLSHKWTDEKTMDYFESLAKIIESRNLSIKHLNILYGFMKEYIRFSDSENYTIFNHTLETITKRKNPMGLKELLKEEGRQEGRQEERQKGIAEKEADITRLLQDGLYDAEGIARVMHVTEEEVLRINELLNVQLH